MVRNAIEEQYTVEWESYFNFVNVSDINITKNDNTSITGTYKLTPKSPYTFDPNIEGLSGNVITVDVNITPYNQP